jgi:signal transduction histidine kinase
LNECADGKIPAVRFLSYGVNDGLPTIECSEGLQPAGGKTPDGRLWFPTSKGLAVVSPDELRINPLPPPMALEVMVVDGATVTNLAAPLRIPPGRNRLDFYYTALSLVAPEKVRFKYRIEGLENDWVDAGTKRQASYSFVPPGSYTFHVIACNNDGVWNETGESLAFTLLPHFWQTWWFKVAGGLFIVVAASGLVWFETRRRMRRRLEILERQQAVERERARIAKDIHDDLGASLTRITMLSQSMHEDAWIPAYVTQNLERIQDTARDLTRSMDEIVWAVNPKHDTLDSLAGYLSRYAHDFLSSAHVRCRLDFPLQLPVRLLTAEVRHNLFLAFKESLHNVVRHAAAGEVCVALKLEANQLVLMVADNGRGFDGGQTADGLPLKPGRLSPGNGLANLRRRLVEIQGRCEVHSQPGRGTTVTFTVPLPAGPAWAAAPGGTVSSKEMTTTPDETRV